MTVALAVSFVWAVGCLLFDAINTNKGLRLGIAEEGNTLITALSGTKYPKLWQLLAIDGGLRAIILGVAFIPGPVDYSHTFTVVSFVALFVAGLKNVRGGRQWKWMISHPGQTIPPGDTFWQKFIGFWG